MTSESSKLHDINDLLTSFLVSFEFFFFHTRFRNFEVSKIKANRNFIRKQSSTIKKSVLQPPSPTVEKPKTHVIFAYAHTSGTAFPLPSNLINHHRPPITRAIYATLLHSLENQKPTFSCYSESYLSPPTSSLSKTLAIHVAPTTSSHRPYKCFDF